MGWLDDVAKTLETGVAEVGNDVEKIVDRWLGFDD